MKIYLRFCEHKHSVSRAFVLSYNTCCTFPHTAVFFPLTHLFPVQHRLWTILPSRTLPKHSIVPVLTPWSRPSIDTALKHKVCYVLVEGVYSKGVWSRVSHPVFLIYFFAKLRIVSQDQQHLLCITKILKIKWFFLIFSNDQMS